MALEYLLDQLNDKSNAISREEIIDVLKDAKLSCALATGTMNDLLMFDKMESNMLNIDAKYSNAWSFVFNCVKSFKVQVY